VDGNVEHRPTLPAARRAPPIRSAARRRGPDSILPVLAWMDLALTGLDPTRHVIVEIATLVTDDELQIVAEGPDLVVSATAEQLDAMDSFVREMHTKSGLLTAIEASTLPLADAATATLDFLRQHLPDPRSVPLAGNSIGTDRRFLATHLPDVERFFHYRSVDVSTVKELVRRWYPDVLAGAPAKKTSHRAMDDIKESVAELAYYRQAVFRAADGPTDRAP
jgi:oligoribonuclease